MSREYDLLAHAAGLVPDPEGDRYRAELQADRLRSHVDGADGWSTLVVSSKETPAWWPAATR